MVCWIIKPVQLVPKRGIDSGESRLVAEERLGVAFEVRVQSRM